MTPHTTPTRLAVAAALLVCASGAAHASDARSLALGGSVIANGKGAPGAFANPASLMAMQRRGENVHFAFGTSVEVRDDAGAIDIALDDENDDLEPEIDDAVAEIDLRQVDVNCLDPNRGIPCLTGLNGLADLSERAVDILDQVDDENVGAQGTIGLGLAFSNTRYPFALHLEARATGRGRLEASEGDIEYFDAFEDVLEDAELSLADIERVPALTLVQDGQTGTLNVLRPQEALTSNVEGGAVVRVTLGASIATTLDVQGRSIDIGVTPKVASLIASGVETTIDEEFGDGQTTEERIEDSEVEGSAFTFDVGASMDLPAYPVRVAAVLRNVVPESIETNDGVTFETGPQLVVGGVYEQGPFTLNGDLALNEADVDSFPTQVLAIGGEIGKGVFAFRAGINHDFAREEAKTGLSLGFGLGAFEIGARVAGVEQLQAGAQLSFSF